jgi:hypothetical protein
MFSSKLTKLEFSRNSDDDPTEWCNRVEQFFEYQGTMAAHKVSMASFHLEGEANCYVLHSMHACNAYMVEVHWTWVQTGALLIAFQLLSFNKTEELFQL